MLHISEVGKEDHIAVAIHSTIKLQARSCPYVKYF
jgi:hypothetical protein